MADTPASVLADDIQKTKDQITQLGRQIFRISSSYAELSPEQLREFGDLLPTHKLMANEAVIYAQMAEFYKASVAYIELLHSINEKVVESAGIARPSHKGWKP